MGESSHDVEWPPVGSEVSRQLGGVRLRRREVSRQLGGVRFRGGEISRQLGGVRFRGGEISRQLGGVRFRGGEISRQLGGVRFRGRGLFGLPTDQGGLFARRLAHRRRDLLAIPVGFRQAAEIVAPQLRKTANELPVDLG